MKALGLSDNRIRVLSCLVLGAVVLVSYLPTLSGRFILDDNPLIKNNDFLKEKHSILSYFAQEDGVTDRRNTPDSYHTGYYRPLTSLSFRLDHILWGTNPIGFRTTNLILHALTCLLLFQSLRLFVQNRQIAFWIVLLFAVHPVNTETVAWASARNNILATLFVLLSFFFYVRGWEEKKHVCLTLSALSFALAVASKEFGLLTLPIIFFYHRLLKVHKRGSLLEILSYLPFVLITLGYFVLRKAAIGVWLTPAPETHLWDRLYFAPYLVAFNLLITLFPLDLHNFIVDYPPSHLNWKAVAGVVFFVSLSLIVWRIRKNRLAVFAIVSFLFGLLPVLNIIPTSAVSLISMRWLYFPMAFLSFGAISIIGFGQEKNRFLMFGILCTVVVYFGTYSHILNRYLWHDEDTFLRQEVLNFRNYLYAGGLAENFFSKEEYEQAEKYFTIAMRQYPNDARNSINYAALLIDTERPERAISLLKSKKAFLITRKEEAEWLNNMGMAYFRMKDYSKASVYLKRATVIYPREAAFWANLGAAFGQMGQYEQALSILKQGSREAGHSPLLEQNLKVAHGKLCGCDKESLTSVLIH